MSAVRPHQLDSIVARLADRSKRGRTEATIQSDVRLLLLAAELNIVDGDVHEILLESQAGERRRIDVEMGSCVIEVKKDLSSPKVADGALLQLTAYVTDRSMNTGRRYVGILTDGSVWQLYHLVGDQLVEVSTHTVEPAPSASSKLVGWISGVLATEEKVPPTPVEIANRLGAGSSAHALEHADLRAVYDQSRDLPEVRIKRELWAKLLTTALGTQFSAEDDDLFVEHTFLVVIAECVAHAAMGFDIKAIPPASLVGGELFTRQAQILGVVEHDFFDWPSDCGDEGLRWIAAVARRLSQFDWTDVRHDVMKTIYESVITPEVRKNLGEYYTPDFLAEVMVMHAVEDPITQRVLDPACGSGTFLFHAVRHYLAAAEAAGVANGQAVRDVVEHVMGVDVHPVATTLARVTYLLAIGTERLQGSDRPMLRIPVFLGDSLQWGQRQSLFTSETLTVATQDGTQLFADELRFPSSSLDDTDAFDRLVSDIAEQATSREPGTKWRSFDSIARRHGLSGEVRATVEATYETMCRLHDAKRNHIWSYFVRNLARPAWLARKHHRVDVLVGNPPWLAYRFMTLHMQETFKSMANHRRLWKGGSSATQQDLSDLFVVRACEQYLRSGGRFSFVMPAGALTRTQYEGFRSGEWTASDGEEVNLARFDPAWDLSSVYPYFFPRTAAVVHGTRHGDYRSLPSQVERWSGSIPDTSAPWSEVAKYIEREPGLLADPTGLPESLYRKRFANGATIFPRVLTTVSEVGSPPIGAGAGRVAIRSNRGKYENKPWKDLESLEGVVERQFVRPLLLGESVLPFRQQPALSAVLPLRNGQTIDNDLSSYPGMNDWWSRANRIWNTHRKSKLSLAENLDYRRKLTEQFPLAPQRVVYTASGMHVAACRVQDQSAVVEHQLYWATVPTDQEGLYLCAILNSAEMTRAVEPFMVAGKGGGRHIDTYIWRVPIPLFDPDNEVHQRLVSLGRRGEEFVDSLDLPEMDHGALRRRIRRAILENGLGAELDNTVNELLSAV